MNIYLIRHTAVDIPKGICYGQTDIPLQSTFEAEARAVLKSIAPFAFDAVYTSPLSRCTKLAQFCGFADARVDSRLMELNFGDWEMKAWDEINQENYAQQWFADWFNMPAPNGESFLDLKKRVHDFLEALPRAAEDIAVFTHGGVINSARVLIDQTPIQRIFEGTPPYGSVVYFNIP